jgi:hypothetical protein
VVVEVLGQAFNNKVLMVAPHPYFQFHLPVAEVVAQV